MRSVLSASETDVYLAGSLDGQVLINGTTMPTDSYKKLAAFLQQDDIMLPNLTPVCVSFLIRTRMWLLLARSQMIHTSGHVYNITAESVSLDLLGHMAKIKCSICSYQLNIW